jgi:hypothetical protein
MPGEPGTGEQQLGQPVTTDKPDGPEFFRRRLNPSPTSPKLPFETEGAPGNTAGSTPSADQERMKNLADEAKQLGVTQDRTEGDTPQTSGADNPSGQTA